MMLKMLMLMALFQLARSARKVLLIDVNVTCGGTPQPRIETYVWSTNGKWKARLTNYNPTDSAGRFYINQTMEVQYPTLYLHFTGIDCRASGDKLAIKQCNGAKNGLITFEHPKLTEGKTTYTGSIDLLDDCIFKGVVDQQAIRVRGRLTCNADGMPLANTTLQLRHPKLPRIFNPWKYLRYLLSRLTRLIVVFFEESTYSLASTKTDSDGNYDFGVVMNDDEEIDPHLLVRNPNCTTSKTSWENICDGKEEGTRLISLEELDTTWTRRSLTRNINLGKYCHYAKTKLTTTPRWYFYVTGRLLCKGKPLSSNTSTVALFHHQPRVFHKYDHFLQMISIEEDGSFEAFGGRQVWYTFQLRPYIYVKNGSCEHCPAKNEVMLFFPRLSAMEARKCGDIDVYDYCRSNYRAFRVNNCPLD